FIIFYLILLFVVMELSELFKSTLLSQTHEISLSIFVPIMINSNVDTEKLQILLDNKAKSGIYQWTHKESGKIYVGFAINLKARLLQYFNFNHLERYKTSYICNALQVHGYSAFSLTIYEHIDITNLDKKEVRELILE